jgi:LPS sulfotransferase NodH
MPLESRPATRFVILAAPRSGSNLLCTLLNSHPEILCHHEVYNPSGIYYAIEQRAGALDLGTIDDRDRSPLAFLERLWSTSLGHRCVGFKMTRGQNKQALEKVLRDPEVRKIVLERRNRIKTYVSTLVAERTGQWEVYSAADLVAPGPRIHLDLDQLRQHIHLNESYYIEINDVLSSTGQRSLVVDYESLANPIEHRSVLGYLGIGASSYQLKARSVKQNPADLRALVSNYDELLGSLEGTALFDELCSPDP